MKMENRDICVHCGCDIYLDEHGSWVDSTGGDICGWNGGNELSPPALGATTATEPD